jgi:hypothetical protein
MAFMRPPAESKRKSDRARTGDETTGKTGEGTSFETTRLLSALSNAEGVNDFPVVEWSFADEFVCSDATDNTGSLFQSSISSLGNCGLRPRCWNDSLDSPKQRKGMVRSLALDLSKLPKLQTRSDGIFL